LANEGGEHNGLLRKKEIEEGQKVIRQKHLEWYALLSDQKGVFYALDT
jgi:hypothetical protein